MANECNVIAAREDDNNNCGLREFAATHIEMRAFHYTKGWSHEVWIVCLALSAVLPPPKEERNDEEEENF